MVEPPDAQFLGPGDVMLETLTKLVDELTGAGYRSAGGDPLERHAAFREAYELIRGYEVEH